jgi:hypothetical protein
MLPKNLRQRKALAVKRKLDPDRATLAKEAKPRKKAHIAGGPKERTYRADRQNKRGLKCAASRHNKLVPRNSTLSLSPMG